MELAVLTIISVTIIYIIYTYNKLITRRNIAKDQFSQIDIQLKRRMDLIPKLVEIVKGYSNYEKDTLIKIIEKRNTLNKTEDINEEIKINNEINHLLKEITVLVEDYPELKASDNYLELQKEITETENKIAIERQFYNDTVLTYNNIIDKFPSNVIADFFKFEKYNFFEEENLKNVEINFEEE